MATASSDQLDIPEVRYGIGWGDRIRQVGADIFRPRGFLTLLEWAERERRWPDETVYAVDQTPHLREVIEAYSDPAIEEITVIKPTQSGFTEGLIVNAVGYHIDHDPRSLLVVIPSVDEAEKWSKKKLQPMLDATPALRGRLEEGSRKTSNTILEKTFTGGSLGIVGSNSARGFRMVTVGTVFGDDVDGWDATAGKGAGSEGDQVTLIRRRTDRVPDRKLVWISTPTRRTSRINRLYDQMERVGEFHVPCPHCGEYQVLRWGDPDSPYGLKWEKQKLTATYRVQVGEVVRGDTVHRPDTAWYRCAAHGCRISEDHKMDMEARGEYLAEDGEPVRQAGVRSVGFWLCGALTITLPGSEWPKLIREFLEVKDHTHALQGFVNTVLAENWEERGDAPPWIRLYERREIYPIGTCPNGVHFLTIGADVQDDRIEVFVWGWGIDKESWLVDHRVLTGDTLHAATWDQVTPLLYEQWPTAQKTSLPVARFAIDTGHHQEAVIAWALKVADRRVMLVKGDHWKNWTIMVGSPSRSEVTLRGKRTGLQLWPIGGALIQQETYGFLGLDAPVDGQLYPPGYIHLPMVDEEVIQQLVAEDLVTQENNHGFTVRQWVKRRHRNEAGDCRKYARAAAEQCGLARLSSAAVATAAAEKRRQQEQAKQRAEERAEERAKEGESGRRGGWLDRRGRRGSEGWL